MQNGEKTVSIQSDRDLKVADVMLPIDMAPLADESTILKDVLEAMDRHRLGVVCIVDQKKHLTGILTEGDVRRKLLHVQKPFAALLADDAIIHAVRSPISITADVQLIDALDLMGEKKIWDLPVVDGDTRVIGLLHLHQAIRGVLDTLQQSKNSL